MQEKCNMYAGSLWHAGARDWHNLTCEERSWIVIEWVRAIYPALSLMRSTHSVSRTLLHPKKSLKAHMLGNAINHRLLTDQAWVLNKNRWKDGTSTIDRYWVPSEDKTLDNDVTWDAMTQLYLGCYMMTVERIFCWWLCDLQYRLHPPNIHRSRIRLQALRQVLTCMKNCSRLCSVVYS